MITVLIFIHAAFGGIALLSATLAVIFKKGGKQHKMWGRIFFYAMLLCSISAMITACLPKHVSPFLFSVGIFSFYFLFTGWRALRYKEEDISIKWDRRMALFMLLFAPVMMVFPIFMFGVINIVQAVFGGALLVFAIQDLRLFRDRAKLKKNWLVQHLTRMLGAYISAITAFVVVNAILPGVVGWLLPGVVGSILITYWNVKLGRRGVNF
ncbi:DUF2306 domain-containing protein [Lishizhenia sp.]|uniref:DUF2306 domain-containing protein n=1 Tax=Lishizhenia sp. TaxID=2497594 RepID=UPI00299DF367|nr:DUF2306 domain-containing protein [Lishizhenia sp.]MDX1445124.1 DUF2306 domain-containing protein [Lishizhenia sp.]